MTLPARLVLLGHPVAHSLSPTIHNAALRAAAIPLEYTALDISPAQLPETMRMLRAEGAAGNVTIPHKRAVFEFCDRITDVARRVGAVNTFMMRDGALLGDNTDVAGFDMAARTLMRNAGTALPKRVALVGAGGAAAAVAAAVEEWNGSELVIWSRGPARAEALVQRFARTSVEGDLSRAVCDADLVVNATPLGMSDDSFPVPIAMLPSGCLVLDLVYKRGETEWVCAARAAGHPASDGLRMLIEQAARAFHVWLGVAPDRDAMWKAAT